MSKGYRVRNDKGDYVAARVDHVYVRGQQFAGIFNAQGAVKAIKNCKQDFPNENWYTVPVG